MTSQFLKTVVEVFKSQFNIFYFSETESEGAKTGSDYSSAQNSPVITLSQSASGSKSGEDDETEAVDEDEIESYDEDEDDIDDDSQGPETPEKLERRRDADLPKKDVPKSTPTKMKGGVMKKSDVSHETKCENYERLVYTFITVSWSSEVGVDDCILTDTTVSKVRQELMMVSYVKIQSSSRA